MKDLKDYSDEELESAWQGQCTMIQVSLKAYYSGHDESMREKAIQAQNKQSEIQKEITRRH